MFRCVFIAAKLMDRIQTGWSWPCDPAPLAITKVFFPGKKEVRKGLEYFLMVEHRYSRQRNSNFLKMIFQKFRIRLRFLPLEVKHPCCLSWTSMNLLTTSEKPSVRVEEHPFFRQRLTHFLKILEIFKIPKFFGELCQNLQFLVKNIFGVTLMLNRYRVSTDLCL